MPHPLIPPPLPPQLSAAKAVTVDGAVVKSTAEGGAYAEVAAEEWSVFDGVWSFDGTGEGVTDKKCFEFGPVCGESSVTQVFGQDEYVIAGLTDAGAADAFSFWPAQSRECPVSIARADSPCADASAWDNTAETTDCQTYSTASQTDGCDAAVDAYCADACATLEGCTDGGCLGLGALANLGGYMRGFEPFGLDKVANTDGGAAASATVLKGNFLLRSQEVLIDGSNVDPVAEQWEMEALCELGIDADASDDIECPEDDLITFTALFGRSFGDAFGVAIRGDLAALAISYVGILAYMTFMLSPTDSVHGMVSMAMCTLLSVLLAFSACIGIGASIGLKDNPLNNNIPFLLLGLGVDDAFVLSGEYTRARKLNPNGSPEAWAISAVKFGGVSILITSVTDALALLVGSATVLPALSWFCGFAGIGVIFSFLLQLGLFIPCLIIHGRRVEANRFDMCCCCKSSVEHPFDEPKGACGVSACALTPGKLAANMREYGKFITKKTSAVATLTFFGVMAVFGVVGCANIETEFKLEWFIPDDSYVTQFFDLNELHFKEGEGFSVYTREIDGGYYAHQATLGDMHDYMTSTKYVDHSQPVSDWQHAFLADVNGGAVHDGGEAEYYAALRAWSTAGDGSKFEGNLLWADPACHAEAVEDAECVPVGTCYDSTTHESSCAADAAVCDALAGTSFLDAETSALYGSTCTTCGEAAEACDTTLGLRGSKMSATLALEHTRRGRERFDTMTALRAELKAMEPTAFPFMRDFLYWEEVGIIATELIRNLIICGVVIFCVVAAMIPHPRIAAWVVVAIFLTVIDLVGFLHWWGVTISSISTIYILISVGLAVDYSAHIAHMFVVSTGNSKERAIGALERIGPSVFNAIVSTLIAVAVLAFSKSYVFRIFFQAFFLTVTIGGIHGLVFLPAALSLFGGDSGEAGPDSPRVCDEKAAAAEMVAVATGEGKPVEVVA